MHAFSSKMKVMLAGFLLCSPFTIARMPCQNGKEGESMWTCWDGPIWRQAKNMRWWG